GAGTKASRSGPQLTAGCPDGRARRSDGRLHTGGWFPLRAAHHSTHRCCVRRAGRAMPSSLKPLHPGGCFSLGTLGCPVIGTDRKSTRLNSSHVKISYAVFCSVPLRLLHASPTRRSSDLDGRARRSDGRLHTGGWFPLRAAHHSTHRCCVRRAGRAMPSSLKPLHPGGCFSLGTLGCPVIGTMVVGRGREDLGKKKARATRCEAT